MSTTCSRCNGDIVPGDTFCAVCGTPVPKELPVTPAAMVMPSPTDTPLSPHRRLWLIGGGSAVAICVLALFISLSSRSGAPVKSAGNTPSTASYSATRPGATRPVAIKVTALPQPGNPAKTPTTGVTSTKGAATVQIMSGTLKTQSAMGGQQKAEAGPLEEESRMNVALQDVNQVRPEEPPAAEPALEPKESVPETEREQPSETERPPQTPEQEQPAPRDNGD